MINKEILESVMSQHFKIPDDYTYENIIDAIDNYTDKVLKEQIEGIQDFSEQFPNELKDFWNEACEEQIQSCSDKCYDLLDTDGDAESWPEKILKTNNAEYPY